MRTSERVEGGRLRIGELAELADTTARAIRHYHAIGLLPEPERDESGYRRYGAEHLVQLIRVRRLRALDMPLDRIAAHLAKEPREPGDLSAALRSLAGDIAAQIARLEALRARALDLAASASAAAPAEPWEAMLRAHGLLDDRSPLPAGEREAVDLLDALHPGGIDGVVAHASGLASDPELVRRLGSLLERFQNLRDDEAAVDRLVAEAAAALPRPEQPAPPVDLETMDKLLGDRFTPAQRQFLHRLRHRLEAERDEP
jgi:DNA-binding transcriptional MerR regulator